MISVRGRFSSQLWMFVAIISCAFLFACSFAKRWSANATVLLEEIILDAALERLLFRNYLGILLVQKLRCIQPRSINMTMSTAL